MLITTGGVLIRTRVTEIREMGRSTQGVTLINLDEGEKLAGSSASWSRRRELKTRRKMQDARRKTRCKTQMQAHE